MKRHSEPSSSPSRKRYEPSQPSISVLPRELLGLIFVFIRLRPRLWVVSVVCKRWRDVVVLLVDVLYSGRAHYEDALALFPNVTSISISPYSGKDFPLPKNLQRVVAEPGMSIRSNGRTTLNNCLEDRCPFACLAAVASVTDADIWHCDHSTALLMSSRSSLTKLAFLGTVNHLSEFYFPALQSLELRSVPEERERFIIAHASQLTRLITVSTPGQRIAKNVTFPLLRELLIRDGPFSCISLPAGVVGWFQPAPVDRRPVTREVTLWASKLDRLMRPAYSLLTAVQLNWNAKRDQGTESVLESLSLIPCLKALKRLHVLYTGPDLLPLPHLGSFPELRDLTTNFVFTMSPETLASLTSLDLEYASPSVATEFILRNLHLCGSLRMLYFGYRMPFESGMTDAQVVGFLLKAQEQGLELVSGDFGDKRTPMREAVENAKYLWLLVASKMLSFSIR